MFELRRFGRSVLVSSLLVGLGGLAQAQQPGYGQEYPAMANSADPNQPDPNQPDPPQRVARISLLEGTASFEPASVNEFSPAEINYPMTTGDRLYAGDGSQAEIQTGQIAVRLGAATDMTVTAMTDTLAQFGLAGGSVHLRTFSIDPGTTIELDTPNAAITVLEPGDIRVDVDANTDLSFVTVLSGRVQIDGTEFEQVAGPGESLRLDGFNPLNVSQAGAAPFDALDQFSSARDRTFEQGQQVDGAYLNNATVGGADLAAYGDWDQDADNGAVWYPRGVAVDWQPYRVGHWAWVAPWGWTWVEAEPWGFAPFHYGRWARFGPRWGWVPGPPVVRPVWAPALVVFVGGDQFSASIGYRGGVTAWFPLGVRETYTPWYHHSDVYLNRVNVTNIYVRDTRVVRQNYNSRTVVSAYAQPMDGRAYANRGVAVVVPQAAFASGRSVAQNAVRLSPQQVASAQVLPHPLVTPAHEIVQPGVARALPMRVARPVLDGRPEQGMPATAHDGTPINGASGYLGNRGGQMQPPQAGQSHAVTYGTVQNPGPSVPVASGVHPVAPRAGEPQPVTVRPTPNPQPAQQPPVGLPRPVARPQPVVTPSPDIAPRPAPVTARPVPLQQQQPDQRSLFNRATPPQPRPSFEQQRQAIETTDPGRPLSPRQMDNVRQNQPAGPPQQREPAAHSVAAPAPPPAKPAAPAPQQKRDDRNRDR